MNREELEARSAAFAAAVFALCRSVMGRPDVRGPAGQLVDAATSIGANYRSSSRSRSRREFAARIAVVAEEADEAVYWLEFFRTTHIGDPDVVDALLAEAKEMRAVFAASYRTARRPKAPPSPE